MVERDAQALAEVNIPTIDQMFDDPPTISAEVINRALDLAMPRAQTICQNNSVEGDNYSNYGIVAYSDEMPYRLIGDSQINLRLCITELPATPLLGETKTHKGVGVVVEAGDYSSRPPVIQLFRHSLSCEPGKGLRYDHPQDLDSLFAAMELFDGQTVLPIVRP